jgi:hypothetical protein
MVGTCFIQSVTEKVPRRTKASTTLQRTDPNAYTARLSLVDQRYLFGRLRIPKTGPSVEHKVQSKSWCGQTVISVYYKSLIPDRMLYVTETERKAALMVGKSAMGDEEQEMTYCGSSVNAFNV